jgi:hypothetical protein
MLSKIEKYGLKNEYYNYVRNVLNQSEAAALV